jgi:ketosteroid isomerase-like protein/RNA polymerase subunit RPABC4/transcription elongation factor Spt4
MLVCMNCHIEYEEGTDFCSQCGGPLVAKEEPTSGQGELSKAEEKKTETRLICPKCKLLYERRETCIRCGARLVKQSDLQAIEEQKSAQAPETRKEEPKKEEPKKEEPRKEPLQVQPPRRQPVETPREKPKSSHADEIEKKPPPLQPSEKPSPKKLSEDMEKMITPPAKGIKSLFRGPLGVVSIVILVAAALYFIWSQYSYFTKKPSQPSPVSPVSSEQATGSSGTSTPTNPAAPVAEPEEKAPSPSETWEVEKIKELLEKIRRANFRKDIDLLMSCYSTDFKDREKRERETLKSWENFSYLGLSYDLKDHTISGNTAKIRVEWSMKISPRFGGQSQESKTLLDVVLKKEDNDWKIEEVIPVG